MLTTERSMLCGVIWLALSSPLSAQKPTLDFSGYVKNLSIRSSSIFTGDNYFLNLDRARLQGMAKAGTWVRAEVWLDSEVLIGDFFDTLDFQLGDTLARPTFVDLNWNIDQGDNYQIRQSLFRAFATVYAGPAAITIGRQRIAWGTGFAWNPTDLLNPFNPAAIELEEKEGVDAIHTAWSLGTFSRVEAAFAPGRKALESSYAAKLTTHAGEYDLSLMSGRFRGDYVIGGDFAGYVGNAGFRGEFTYTFLEDDANYVRAVLNADYNFPHDFYTLLELYYNGRGESDKENYRIEDLLNGKTFNLAQFYAATSVTKNLTPLLNASVYGIFNLNDLSGLLGPSLQYSLGTNLEVNASTYFLFGSANTEYGQLKSSYFASLQYFF